jgi:hypothetical protein
MKLNLDTQAKLGFMQKPAGGNRQRAASWPASRAAEGGLHIPLEVQQRLQAAPQVGECSL